jgi:D-tyrosyl-tRNA(Tyr) deacylase
MKAVIMRINKGRVIAEDKTVSSVDKGLAVFVGVEKGDDYKTLEDMAYKIVHMRLFENEEGRLDHSVHDKKYHILCISNFTLCASTDKGRRPSFEQSMPKEEADKLFNDFVLFLKAREIEVQVGAFGEHMDIDLDLNGPVNIILDSKR